MKNNSNPADAMAVEAVGPTYREVLALRDELDTNGLGTVDLVAFARAVLARYGPTPPRPIPVGERLPGAEDCDAGRCYWGRQVNSRRWSWTFSIDPQGDTHWLPAGVQSLPAHALPIPTQENTDAT